MSHSLPRLYVIDTFDYFYGSIEPPHCYYPTFKIIITKVPYSFGLRN